MKICIFGAGAIGGYLGVELALAGIDVSLIARGDHLDAMRRDGLTLLFGGEKRNVRVQSTDDPAELGPQDAVIVAAKAHSMPAIAESMAPLLAEHTSVVTAQNGIPWWYFHRFSGPFEGQRVQSVDPGGRIWDSIGPERAIGCVVYPSTEIVEPGVVRHLQGNRFLLGEPDGSQSERVSALSQVLTSAGFKAPVRKRIRDDIWLKLWGNASFNPISVLTLATLREMTACPGTRQLIRDLMAEVQLVAERLGARFPVTIEKRIGWAEKVGDHKTSMLQDFEQGRSLEIDALVAAVVEIGDKVGVETALLQHVLALVRLRDAIEKRGEPRG